jgi:hypothetical protein
VITGIDVQAELRLKTGSNSSTIPPMKSNANAAKQPLPLERAALSRTSAQRRQVAGAIAPKPDLSQQRDGAYSTSSPQPQPTPSSHVSSPSTGRSPGFALQGAMSPKGSEFRQRNQPPLLPHPRDFSQQNPLGVGPMRSMDPYASASQSVMSGGTMAPHLQSYYSAPFQKHYDQLGKCPCLRQCMDF